MGANVLLGDNRDVAFGKKTKDFAKGFKAVRPRGPGDKEKVIQNVDHVRDA